ncbi:MAG: hypothetical protein AAFR71_11495 [Pseudomonadota bacterium]
MDPAALFLVIGFGIIVLAMVIGALFNKTAKKQMPGRRGGTGVGGVVPHNGKSNSWFDGDDGGGGGD